jgi:ribosomal protein S18 acetylase RimI-like enzyme
MQTPPRASIRRATVDDYAAFARLFPELLVDDSVPAFDVWTAALVPFTWVATLNDEIVGYCYSQEFDDTGCIRNIVVAPHVRRQGIGIALMNTIADHLHSNGKRLWRLNVKPTNAAAIALYRRLGLNPAYHSWSIRFPWAALPALPQGTTNVQTLTPERQDLAEKVFSLPRGQLAMARDGTRLLVEAIYPGSLDPVGLAVFDPRFPGAFPFRVTTIDALVPLLTTIRLTVPEHVHTNLVVEEDESLAKLFLGAGATLRDDILHLRGDVPLSLPG